MTGVELARSPRAVVTAPAPTPYADDELGLSRVTEDPILATLVAARHKNWLTRPRPAPTSLLGARVAIHAHTRSSLAARNQPGQVGRFTVEQDNPRRTPPAYLLRGLAHPYRVPTGAIVAAATLASCTPIVRLDQLAHFDDACIADGWHDRLTWYSSPDDDTTLDLEPERPYGTWTPGWWVWQLVDIERVRPREVDSPARARLLPWAARP